MNNLQNKFKQIVLMIMLLTLFTLPRSSFAQLGTIDWSQLPLIPKKIAEFVDTGIIKNAALKQLVKDRLEKVAFDLAQKAADKSIRSVVNWANNDFNGKPFYADDYYTIAIGAEKLATIKELTRLKNSKSPDKNRVMRMMISEYNNKLLPAAENAYLDKTINSKDFQDFSNGNFAVQGDTFTNGWNALDELFRKPELTPAGKRLAAINQKNAEAEQIQKNTEKEKADGQGFQDKKECADGVSTTTLADGKKYCPRYATTTPGKIIEGQLAKALNRPAERQDKENKWGNLMFSSLVQLGEGLIGVGLSKVQTSFTSKVRDTFQSAKIDPSLILDDPTLNGNITASGSFQLGAPQSIIDIEKTLGGDPNDPINNPGVIKRTENIINTYKSSIEKLKEIPIRIYKLDSCIPGPNYKWEERFEERFRNASQKVQNLTMETDPDESDVAMYDSLVAQKTSFSQIVKLNAIAPPTNKNIPGYADYQALIPYAISFLEEKNNTTNIIGQKTLLKSQLTGILDKWREKQNSTSFSQKEKADLLYKYELLSAEISNSPADSEEATKYELNINETIKKLDDSLASCISERKKLYGTKPTYSDTFINASKTGQIDGGMSAIKTMEDANKILGPLKILNIGDAIFGSNVKEDIRRLINKAEEADPELYEYCNKNYFTIWAEENGVKKRTWEENNRLELNAPEEFLRNKALRPGTPEYDAAYAKYKDVVYYAEEPSKTKPPLNGPGKGSGFLGFSVDRYQGVLCTDFYYGKSTDYIEKFQ